MNVEALHASKARAAAGSSVPFLVALTIVCLMQLGLSIWRTRDTYFILDDFLNFIVVQDMGLTWHYLFRDLFGHVTPLYRLVQALYLSLVGLHFEAARFLILFVALVPSSMFMLIGRRLQVPLPINAAGALLIGCLPQLGQAEFWWSNSLLVVPGFAALFTTLWLLVGGHGEGPNRREAALAGVAFAVGLGFYDKNLFGSVLLLAVLIMIRLDKRSFISATLRAIFDLRYVMGVSMAWAVALIFLRDPSPEAPTLKLAIQFIWLAWDDASLGALFGMGSSGFQPAVWWLAPLAAHALLILLIGYSVWRGGIRTTPVWVSVFIYIVVTLALTARMRAGIFGADLGRLLRYAVEPAAFIVTATVLSLSKTSPKSSWIPATFLLVIAGVDVVLVTVPTIGYPGPTRAFVFNVRQSLAKHGDKTGIVLLDEALPEYVMAGWMAPLNVPSRFIPLLGKYPFSYAHSKEANWKLDPSGVLTPIPR